MDYLAVAVAGFFGAIARKLVSVLMGNVFSSGFPLGTLVVNISGCFILGLFTSLASERFKISSRLRTAIGTGFLGAYTTFSTFSLDTVTLFRSMQQLHAVTYLAVTSFGCVFLAWVGTVVGRSIALLGAKPGEFNGETDKAG